MNYLAITIPRKELGTRAEARNQEIERALQLKAEYILMIDTDQTIPILALSKMFQEIQTYDIVIVDAPNKDKGGSNVTKNPDRTIAYSGMGCVLFRASIFSQIGKPFFDDRFGYAEKDILNGKLVIKKFGKYQQDNKGEEIDFWFKVKDKFKIKIIEDPKCNHIEL